MPFYNYREHATPYAGPGREIPEPASVDEVRLGYFGPSDPDHPEGGDLWCAAKLAIEEANRQGGYKGKPFRLMPGWSDNPWKAGVVHVTRMVYTDNVWAILGGIDGPSTHLAEQVVVKARLPLVSPGNTDRTANLANVAWMFSCLPGDQLQAPVLADRLVACVGNGPFEVLSGEEHDSRCFMSQLNHAFASRKISPRHFYVCPPATQSSAEAVGRVLIAKPLAVVVVASARESALLVKQLRYGGFVGPVFGGPSMGRRRFLEEAGSAAGEVVFPLLYDPKADPGPFAETFETRFHHEPDYAAAAAFDSVQLLVAAVRRAGLNRAAINDALRSLSPWKGVSGVIEWDALGSNSRPVSLGTIKNGQRVPLEPGQSQKAPKFGKCPEGAREVGQTKTAVKINCSSAC